MNKLFGWGDTKGTSSASDYTYSASDSTKDIDFTKYKDLLNDQRDTYKRYTDLLMQQRAYNNLQMGVGMGTTIPSSSVDNRNEKIEQLTETNEMLRNSVKLNKVRMNEMAEFIKELDTPEGKKLLKKLEID